MPKAFIKCVNSGGKVRTKRLSKGRYIHLCKTKSGKWVAGEVKVKRSK